MKINFKKTLKTWIWSWILICYNIFLMIFLFIKPLCCGAEMLLPLQMDLSMNVIFLLFLLEIDGRERNMPQVNNSSQNIKLRWSLRPRGGRLTSLDASYARCFVFWRTSSKTSTSMFFQKHRQNITSLRRKHDVLRDFFGFRNPIQSYDKSLAI